MKMIGLTFIKTKHIPAATAWDLCVRTESQAVGGGEWALELYDSEGNFLKEYVGPNGTRADEEAADLYAIAEADRTIVREERRVDVFQAPDGTRSTLSWFERQARHGHLHGCIVEL